MQQPVRVTTSNGWDDRCTNRDSVSVKWEQEQEQHEGVSNRSRNDAEMTQTWTSRPTNKQASKQGDDGHIIPSVSPYQHHTSRRTADTTEDRLYLYF